MNRIIPEEDLRDILLKVAAPGRYVGGEYGSVVKPDAKFSVALCFPDLYEIGMSNQAVKILYSIINNETEAACERVFNPAPDLDEILRRNDIPLYTLESGKSVRDHDILAFTVGYELSATNILSVLETSGIKRRNDERTETEPVLIAGGPAITNPVPFGSFIDAVFIGEAEGVLPEMINRLSAAKDEGAERGEILDIIRSSEYFWFSGKDKPVKKAVWNGFGKGPSAGYQFLVPSVKTVQDHGVVEIMRGCPNGCRFCHAGIFYRPYREKEIGKIISEVDSVIRKSGYREITLSSLSSGDYKYISELIRILNRRYSSEKISFSFPSMRVNSFTLPLISEISKVRKSGLTFAVETPDIIHQRGLNKEAPKDRIIEILSEAKKMGWSKAKFYFMVGLPFFSEQDETDSIIDFLREVGREAKMQLNVNIGTFIPKPHTPFQWSFQLTEEEAFRRVMKIKKALPDKFFKVSFQSPFISFIEGFISRGDESSGDLIIDAYEKGARLDAWEEHMNKDAWRSAFEQAGTDVEKMVCTEKSMESELPWDDIILGAGRNFFKTEAEKAFAGELTDACAVSCAHNCGACNTTDRISINEEINIDDFIQETDSSETTVKKILFSFEKTGKAAFLSHINVMNVFERSFLRAGINLRYTEGFNPKPKLEFANPITLGFESDEEIASVEINVQSGTTYEETCRIFSEKMNDSLPSGFKIGRAKSIKMIESEATGKKVKSLMSSYNGGEYKITCRELTTAEQIEKAFAKIDGVSVELSGFNLCVNTAKAANGRILNIFKVLKEDLNYENPFDHVTVRRLKTICSISHDGADKRLDYFTCYKAAD